MGAGRQRPVLEKWLAFLRQIAARQLPAEFKALDHHQIDNMHGLAEDNDEPWKTPETLPLCSFRAEPMAHPGHFRLRLTETNASHSGGLLLDEVLDDRAFVGAFCAALEDFLAWAY
jgi:hypothetical protein